MSHDAMFAVRRGGQDRCFYDRWAALQVDRLLLTGPDATVAYIERLTPTPAPVTVAWLCGAVFVDLDRRALLFWADPCFGAPMLQRYYAALLAPRWPGFRVRQATQPVREFAAALGCAPRELAEAQARAAPVAAPDDLFTRAWDEFLAAEDPAALAAWREGSSDADIRDAIEHGHDAWVTLRAADGALHDQRCSSWMWESLLCAGPRLAALARAAGPRPDMLWPGFERDLRETVFIDEPRRTVHAWRAPPAWLSPAGFCGPLWPGWTVEVDDGGPRSHIERSGRAFAEIRLPRDDLARALAEQLQRLGTGAFAPRALLAREAARLQAEHPGATLRVETAATDGAPVGADAVPAATLAELAALIDAVDGI